MKKSSIAVALFIVISFCKLNFLNAQVNVQDSLALVDLYNSTDGPHWKNSYHWLSSYPVSSWFGITSSDNIVWEIHLEDNGLNGTIPIEIANISKLWNLNLSNNKLTGNLPSELGNLHNLRYLDLDLNNLTGSIPSSLGNLIRLSDLYLSHNKLTGSIPSSLGNLSKLDGLYLSNNKLSGSIPSSLGNINSLSSLELSNNQLTGDLPDEFGNLDKLRFLTLDHNKLSGGISPKFKHCYYLNLSFNKLSGNIPREFGLNSTWYYLDLSHNQLSGKVPSSINTPGIHSQINISYNNFIFAGMLNLVKYFDNPIYSPQAHIPIHKAGNILSVYTGGPYQLALDTFKWYKNGTLVATIIGDSDFVANEEGLYNVAVTNSVATELTLHSDTINYSASNNLIASKMNNHSFISLYPNPAKTNATLSFIADGKYIITIADVSGKTLRTKTGVAVKGTNNIQLDVSKYASGMYLITIIDEKNKKQTLRLNKE